MIQNISNLSMNKVYYINIDESEELGMFSVSLVDFPAVETQFLCFNEEKPKQLFFAKPEEKIITGVALRADLPIYRRNAKGEEFYVIFNKETIAKLVERYSKNGLFNIVNLQHDHSLFTENAILVESYFIDKERGIAPKEYGNLTDGSWVVSFKIEDKDLWEQIKNGNDLNGFSVEVAGHLVEKFESEKTDTPEVEINKLIDEILEK